MSIFIIFWSVVLALTLFVLCIVFRLLSSVVEGGLIALGYALLIGVCAVVLLIALYLIHAITCSIMDGTFLTVLFDFIFAAVVLAIVGGIFAAFGSAILAIAGYIILGIAAAIAEVIESLGDQCEKGYTYFINTISNRIDRC